MLCGLGSWREQQQTIERDQKTRLLYDKTTQYPAGFITVHRLDATPDGLDYTYLSGSVNPFQKKFVGGLIKQSWGAIAQLKTPRR